MKRMIYIIALGYIFGIIGGLLFKKVLFIFPVLILLIFLFKIVLSKFNKNILRVFNIFLKNNIIIIFLISSMISYLYIFYIDLKYERIYNDLTKGKIIATIVSTPSESEYYYTYEVKLEKYNNKKYYNVKLLLKIPKNGEVNVKYGDKLEVNGEYELPEISRNYRGFNYRNYLKGNNIYGIFKAKKWKVIKNNNLNFLRMSSWKFKHKVIDNIANLLPQEESGLFFEILLGYKEEITDDIKESFKISSLSHLLVISGAHIVYIILGFKYFLKLIKIPQRFSNIIICLMLIFFMYMTNFTSSVIRASIMNIIVLFSLIFYRKVDIKTSLSISILITLLGNPYRLCDIGLLLSYFSTIGIVCVNKILRINKNKDKRQEYNKCYKELLKRKYINNYIC